MNDMIGIYIVAALFGIIAFSAALYAIIRLAVIAALDSYVKKQERLGHLDDGLPH